MTNRAKSGGILVEFQPMSPEERERMMQFLLNQQAQFAADLAKGQEQSRERFERAEARLDRIEGAIVGLTGLVGRIGTAQEDAEQRMRELSESQKRTDEQLRQTDAQLRRTDEHFAIVVTMFERHLRENHGASPE